MVTDTREISSRVSNTARERSNFRMEIAMKEIITTASLTVMASTIGETEASTKEGLYKEKEMALEFGKLQ